MRRRHSTREYDPKRRRRDRPANALMMFTWAWRVPDLKRLPPAQRRLAIGRAIRSMQVLIVPLLLLLGIPATVLLSAFAGAIVRSVSAAGFAVVFVFFPIGLAVGTGLGFACALLLTTPLRRNVRREMNTLGVPICAGCGYNLVGLACDPSTRADVRTCPECGRALPGAPG